MKDSKIEWCDHTFNPWIGCTKVSPGCKNCYAESLNKRWRKGENWGKGAPRSRTSASNWNEPRRWNRDAEALFKRYEIWETAGRDFSWDGGAPRRPRVFCASLADWLDDEVPQEWRIELLDLIRQTPFLDWLLLTKRPQNFRRLVGNWGDSAKASADLQGWIYDWFHGEPPDNVWIGTSVEDQQRADERVPELIKIPAGTHFLSCEPLLGPVDLQYPKSLFPTGAPFCCSGEQCACRGLPTEPPLIAGIDWVIVGGESGADARPMHPEWALSLRDQCKDVAFLFKQWGEWLPDVQRKFTTQGNITWGLVHLSGRFREVLDCGKRNWSQDPGWISGEQGTTKVGKKAAGRELDGRTWDEFPKAIS